MAQAQKLKPARMYLIIEGLVVEVSVKNNIGDRIKAKNGATFVTATMYGMDKPLYCYHQSLFDVWQKMLGKEVKVKARMGSQGHITVDWIRIGEEVYKPASEEAKNATGTGVGQGQPGPRES